MEIKDYLYLYVGQKAIHPALKNERELTGSWIESLIVKGIAVKPILRPLYDMTETELNECGNIDYDFSDDPELSKHGWRHFDFLLSPNQFKYLLNHGFDLFGLIESNLAISKPQTHEQ